MYFECIVGNGGGGLSSILVTMTSSFAGKTVTCSNGTDTYTAICPSSSPYTVQFDNLGNDTWTVSCTVSGTTYSDSVVIDGIYPLDLTKKTISVDVYGAANDTISYTDIDGFKTITTNANGVGTASITFNLPSKSITFTSTVAKNPNSLSNAYSKAITINASTTSIKVMPDGAIYWWGYINNLETMSTANGWSKISIYSFINPTYETYDVYLNTSQNGQMAGIGSKNSKTASTFKYIAQGISARSASYGNYGYSASKNPGWDSNGSLDSTDMKLYSLAGGNNKYYGVTGFTSSGTASSKVYAIWAE